MSATKTKRPLALWLLIGCLGFLSVGGFVGGAAFTAEPSGKLIQMSLEPLQKLNLPIQDYFWPGVFLLLAFGILPLVVGYGLLARPKVNWVERLNWWHAEYWALSLNLLLSVALMAWIIIEVILIGLSWFLQPLLLGLGLVMLGLGLLPSMRQYYAQNQSR